MILYQTVDASWYIILIMQFSAIVGSYLRNRCVIFWLISKHVRALSGRQLIICFLSLFPSLTHAKYTKFTFTRNNLVLLTSMLDWIKKHWTIIKLKVWNTFSYVVFFTIFQSFSKLWLGDSIIGTNVSQNNKIEILYIFDLSVW